ncbi:MAG TPA: MFS transporter [Polyangiaceae bacterium]
MTTAREAPLPASTPADDPRAARVLLIVFFTVFLDLVGFGIILPSLPLYVQSMGGTPDTVGFLFSCFAGTQFVATPILGRLSDRVGRRRVILTSLAGNAASMVLFALASHARLLPLLFVSRILAGATAGNLAACQAAVADVTRGAARARGMGRIGAAIGLGMALGPVLGGWASKLGPEAAPLASAALAALDLLAALALMPETRPDQPAPKEGAPASQGGPPSLAALLRDPRIAAVLALNFVTFLYMTTMQVVVPLTAHDRFGWAIAETNNLFGFIGFVMLVVQGGLIGRLAKAFGPGTLVVAGALSSAAALSILAKAGVPPALVAGSGLLALGLGLTMPILSALASEYAGASRQGFVLGFAQSAGGLARTIGPSLWGFLYGHASAATAFFGAAVTALVALVLATGLRAAGQATKSRG